MGLVGDLPPRAPHDAVTGEQEPLVTAAIVLECAATPVHAPAIGFHDQPVLWPKEVNLDRTLVEHDPLVDARSRNPGVGAEIQEPLLEHALGDGFTDLMFIEN